MSKTSISDFDWYTLLASESSMCFNFLLQSISSIGYDSYLKIENGEALQSGIQEFVNPNLKTESAIDIARKSKFKCRQV